MRAARPFMKGRALLRKYFLVALMAATVVAVASPAASVAGKQTSSSKQASCRPGSHDCKCPPGTHNSAYCVRGTPLETADAAARAALSAAEDLTGRSRKITFTFTARVTGKFRFVLQFEVPGTHPRKFIDVAAASGSTRAGAADTISVPLSAYAEQILALGAAGHKTLTVIVYAVSITATGSATKHLLGSFTVG